MVDRIRDFINKSPWLGWVVAGVILVGSFFVYRFMSGSGDPYSVERLSEMVTIKCVETGEEWEMTRGQMELELRQRQGMIKDGEGLQNPKTGKFTGYPFSKREWSETVKRLNEARQAAIDRRGGKTGGGKEKK
ncbi:MAG: hypothetical protein IT435_09665 [Phycisphaerales bacterium]|nr:hypothetical protein [Phycisphaerales bacterium]